MGGGDLNLKKSWHPQLMTNQKRVWEEEQKALSERKKIDQMMKERAEERAVQELQELQESAGGKKRQQRVDWMYSGPSTGQIGTTEEMEGYLLGKRRVDGLLKGTDHAKLEKSAKEDSFMAVQNANTARDTAAKVRDDPLLAIKKQQQAAYEAVMNDPVKRRMLLKAAGHDDTPIQEHERKRRKRHHHHDSRRDERSRSRDQDSHRHRDRRRGQDRSRERPKPRHHPSSRYEDEGMQDGTSSYRRPRSGNPSDSRSGSDSEAHPSPRTSHRLRTPPRRRSSSPAHGRRRSRSPRRSYKDDHRMRKTKSWHSSGRNGAGDRRFRSRSPVRTVEENDAASRLAAMQHDATELDEQRQQRLRDVEQREQADAERLDQEQAQNAKYGGRASFVNGMHRQAGDLTLADRIGRAGRGQQIQAD